MLFVETLTKYGCTKTWICRKDEILFSLKDTYSGEEVESQAVKDFANFIVLAFNSHNDLIEALQMAYNFYGEACDGEDETENKIMTAMKAAIVKAGTA